jgi:hypothetical protein
MHVVNLSYSSLSISFSLTFLYLKLVLKIIFHEKLPSLSLINEMLVWFIWFVYKLRTTSFQRVKSNPFDNSDTWKLLQKLYETTRHEKISNVI